MKIIIDYIKKNSFLSVVGFYFLFSTLLKAYSGHDFCIPCLWKLVLGVECPGCGLTTAFISILELNFIKAIEANWLIFLIIPFGLFYVSQDFIKFRRKYNA